MNNKTTIDKNEAIACAIKTIKLLLEHKPVRNIDETIAYLEQAKSQQNTLNRDKVKYIMMDFIYGERRDNRYFLNGFDKAADAICSLSLPALGDGEKMEDFYRNKSRTKAYFPPPTKPPPKN